MTKLEAVQELLEHETNRRRSKASYRRFLQAVRVLDLASQEVQILESHFDYRDCVEPYALHERFK